MPGPPEVFISFASRDGEAFAEAVRVRLERESPALRLWKDHISLEGGLKWWDQIQQALDQVRFLVLIVTPSVLQEELAPVVQKELRYAREHGVWIYAVMGAPRDQLPFEKFPRWLEKLTKTTFYDFRPNWPSPWDQPVPGHDYQFTHEWDRFVRQLDRVGRPPRVRNTAPTDLPANYVRRQAEYDQLHALLLQADRRSPIAITTSLHGPGGFGKTTLAKDLCRDAEIQEAFDDGILWVTLGEKPNIRDALAKLYNELTGKTAGFKDEEEAVQQLRPILEDRDLLIVIDDVWSADHVRPFLEGGKHAARLFTTREMTVAAEARRHVRPEGRPAADWHNPWVTVDEPAADLAVEMLLRGLPDRPPDDQLPLYRDLAVRRLGRWPLLIDLIASEIFLMIEEGESPQQALALVNAGLDEEGLTVFQPAATSEETALRRERSARLTIDASLKRLSADDRRHYEELAIFPEDVSIPSTTLRALWRLSDFKTQQLAQNLGRRSLLKYDGASKSIRLHDVFRTYLDRSLQNPPALHARLVEGWGDLHNLPDVYAWRHVAHHLFQAGRQDRLRALLLDYRWLRAKLRATDAIALRDDAALFPDDPDLKYLARALGQSAHVLVRDPRALRGQLYGRLMEIKSAATQRLVDRVRNATEDGPWLRPLRPTLTPADSPLVRVLEGHWGGLFELAVTPDGRTAVAQAGDNTVRAWDLATGQARTLGRFVRAGGVVAVTPDGRTAVSGSYHGVVRVQDLATGRVRELKGGSGWVKVVAVTPDGRTAVSGSGDHTVWVWDLASGQGRVLEGHCGSVRAVAVTPDGRTAVSGSEDHTVRVWDLATGEARTLEGHSGAVHEVAVTADGRTAVSGSGDHTVRVWDLATGQARTLEGHGDSVYAVAVTPDGRTAVSGSGDHTVRVWDLATGQARTLEGHGYGVTSLAVTPDGRTAVSGSGDSSVRVWDLATGQAPTLERHGGRVSAVAVTPDGRTAVSASEDRKVRVWDLATGEARILEGHGDKVYAVAVTADGRTAVSGSSDHTVRVWDLATGEARILEGHGDEGYAVAVTPDGRTAVSGSGDSSVRVWDLATGQARTLKGKRSDWRGRVNAVAVTPDGRTAVSGSMDHTVRVWDLATGQTQARWGGSGVCAVAVTPDSRTAVWDAGDTTVRVWNLATGEERTLVVGGHGVNAVAVTPDSRTVVSGSDDHTVRVWDLATGEARTLEGHGGPVCAVAVTPDGRTIVSGSSDRTVRVWNPAKAEALATFYADNAVTSFAVSEDGQVVVAGDTGWLVHFLKLER